MDAFGDVSGHFRSLIQGHCNVVVVGIVAGDRIAAARCPNKTVRKVQDIDEAKWNDLTDTQKRRLFECFNDNDYLEFGYALFTQEKLNTLKNHYLLHQDVSFPPDWDLALTGYAYGEILFELDALEENHLTFTFDRVASVPQSKDIVDHIHHFVPTADPFIKRSHNSGGIQAADCFAGAIAEDYKRDTNWSQYIDSERKVACSQSTLIQLQNQLDKYTK